MNETDIIIRELTQEELIARKPFSHFGWEGAGAFSFFNHFRWILGKCKNIA